MSKMQAYNSPFFSFLDLPDHRRGVETFPRSLDIYGQEINGRLYLANDDEGVLGVDDHWQSLGGRLTPTTGAAFSTAPALSSAGGQGDVSWVFSNTGPQLLADVGGTWDPGTDDFIVISMHRISQYSQLSFAQHASTSVDGYFWYKTAGAVHRFYWYDGAVSPSQILTTSYTYAATMMTAAIDRDYASGSRCWWGGYLDATANNPTAASGAVGNGQRLTLNGRTDGLNKMTGELTLAALFHAPAWLDLSDTSEIDRAIKDINNGIYGRHFSSYQGTVKSPTYVNENVRNTAHNFRIDGSNILGHGESHPVESEDGVDLYVHFWDTVNHRWDLPSDNIPTGGVWSVEFNFRHDVKPGSTLPFFSISDGSAAEEFKISFTSAGYIQVDCISAGGSNGQVIGSVDLFDDAYRFISVSCYANHLSVQIDGASVGIDTSSTMPAGADTLRLGSDSILSGYGHGKIKYGPGYGLQIYDYARH